jgi:hypothetical protein
MLCKRPLYHFNQSLECNRIALAKIEHPLLGFIRGRNIMKERPTPIKDQTANLFRCIQGRHLRGTQGSDQQDELQIWKAGVIQVQGLHQKTILFTNKDYGQVKNRNEVISLTMLDVI